jgi:hypothetical protein
MGVNIKYKDNLFIWLFKKPEHLRELYCAIAGIPVDHDVPVTINTLDNVLFGGQKNDISFRYGSKLVTFFEHQSTLNPNMPLRFLMYLGRVYETILGEKKRYSSKLYPIPQPEFIVLYNGTDPYPDKGVLKLSDAFENAAAAGLIAPGPPPLELTAKVYNINAGKNEAITRNCDRLKKYGLFIAKAREYQGEGETLDNAIKKAIVYCKDHDILADILKAQSAEVMSMWLGEWDQETALAVRKEEGREETLLETARNALQVGVSPELVQIITACLSKPLKK